MNTKILNDKIQEASELLDNVHVEFSVLQDRKTQLFPHLSDAQFARLLGVMPATYGDYKGKKAAMPSLKVGLKAALLLDLDLRSLVPEAEKIKHFFNENIREHR